MPLSDGTVAKALDAVEEDVRGVFSDSLAPREPAYSRDLEDTNLEEEKIYAVSDHLVVVPWVYRCTHIGDFLGVPPTFVDLEIRGTTFLHVIGTDTLEWPCWRYIDFMGALHQMGVTTTSRPALTPDQYEVWRHETH